MMKTVKNNMDLRGLLIIFISTLILISLGQKADGQEKPPRPIQVFVNPAQGIYFGAFCHDNSGGTLTIDPYNVRTGSSSVIPLSLGYLFSPAIFQIEGIKGTVISITDNSSTNFTLFGSNGGSLTFNLLPPATNTDCGSPFILNAESPARMEIRIGGKLTVGNSAANPPGEYSGSFTVIFNQE